VRPWGVTSPSTTGSPVPSAERPAALARELVDLGTAAGLSAVGVADAAPFAGTRTTLEVRRAAGLHGGMQFTYRNPARSTDPDRILPGARSLVVGALGYLRQEPGTAAGGDRRAPGRPTGRVARYARVDHYRTLRVALDRVADHLRADGWRARVVADDNALVDRAAAQRAGLGWFGRNTLLLLPGFGSWSVLGTVVTDAPLDPTAPRGPSAPAEGCGTCRRCMAACPTGALVDDGVLDARRCLAWLVQAPGAFPEEFRAALGDRIYGCDDCQQACPVNRTGERHHAPPPPDPGSASDVDLLDLLAASDADLLADHGRWYIAERDPRYLRRNALVALGNVGDGTDAATVATLDRFARGDDMLLAEHARWAQERLGHRGVTDGAPGTCA
jgi:epoxyqueuosine reductase